MYYSFWGILALVIAAIGVLALAAGFTMAETVFQQIVAGAYATALFALAGVSMLAEIADRIARQ